MKERLIHILDHSVCLSRRQMKEYLGGTMQREEMHATEIHLNACPLCSMAMEGFEAHSDEALAAIASLNSGFLKEHFDNIAPQIHLNSMAPAATIPAADPARKRGAIQPLWRTASIAAAALLAFGVLWYMEFGRSKDSASGPLAIADRPQVTADTHPAQQIDKARPKHAAAPQPVTVTSSLMKEEPSREAAAAAAVSAKKEAAKAGASRLAANAKSKDAIKHGSPDIMTNQSIAAAAPGLMRAMPDQEETASAEQKKKAPAPAKSKAAVMKPADDADTKDPMELGDESFDKGKYSSALAHYKRQMNTGDSRKRSQATIKAARCYASLGNKVKAEQLLQGVINEGAGPERRAARRLLRDLE